MTTTHTASLGRAVTMSTEGQPVIFPTTVPAGTVVYVGKARQEYGRTVHTARVPHTLLRQTVPASALIF
jgi:hypothetical protein